MSLIKSLKDLRHSLFYSLIISRSHNMTTLGDECTWTLDTSGLTPSSVVYSAGVGGDISFEKQLTNQFGCEIILLDPSPTGEATMNKPENQHPKLKFQKVGLADSDGDIVLCAPENKTEQSSYFMSSGDKGISVPCLSLPRFMKMHGHTCIDLLKMDIEGFEYGVLKQICAQKLPVKQICVEFHHSLIPGITRQQTIGAIIRLLCSGYKLIHRKDWDHTFIRS